MPERDRVDDFQLRLRHWLSDGRLCARPLRSSSSSCATASRPEAELGESGMSAAEESSAEQRIDPSRRNCGASAGNRLIRDCLKFAMRFVGTGSEAPSVMLAAREKPKKKIGIHNLKF